MDEYLEAMQEDMQKATDALRSALGKIRTGRATPKLLDSVNVEVQSYGASMPINQLATVQAADARLLVVTPWDKTTLSDVERAIVAAGLGLNPSSDGQVIRVPVPPLTADRRRSLVKVVRREGEDAKVRGRHVRREYNEMFKAAEGDGDISEDELHKMLAKVQESTNAYTAQVDKLVESKEAEVLEI